MKRYAFVEEKSLRPRIPFRDLLVDSFVYNYQGHIHASKCHLTIYNKQNMILGIAHETPGNKGLNLGDGARYFWRNIKREYPAKEHIWVQGHNGFYEYVELFPEGRGYMGDAKWSPAGTLQEVLERHLS